MQSLDSCISTYCFSYIVSGNPREEKKHQLSPDLALAQGQVENAETETENGTLKWKPKYGNRNTEVRQKATYRFTNVPCRQRVTVSKQCENQVVIHRTPASTNIVV